jgi:putative NADH-flavin reductase
MSAYLKLILVVKTERVLIKSAHTLAVAKQDIMETDISATTLMNVQIVLSTIAAGQQSATTQHQDFIVHANQDSVEMATIVPKTTRL